MSAGDAVDWVRQQNEIERLRNRLARIEEEVRALADKYERHSAAIGREGIQSLYQEGFLTALDDSAADLRAILNTEKESGDAT